MKIFGSLVVALVFGFLGFFATMITALMGGVFFYAPLFAIITVAIIVYTILAIFGKAKNKATKRSLIIFAALCVISITSYEIYQSYMDSLKIGSSQDVNLHDYRPFEEGSQLVTLDEAPTLKLEDNLPKLDGSTALYPIYAAFVQAVYPEKEYPLYDSEVVSSQTGNAFNRLVDGKIDIAFMPYPSDKQLQHAERSGVELNMTPIGREAFVFFVNSKNPIENLTIEQIQKIYSGEITNWSDVGGENEKIHAFQRPEGSGSQTALLNVMDGKPLIDPPTENVVSGMGGIIEQTSNYTNYKGAFGFSFRYFSEDMVKNGDVRNIAIEGVAPTKETIQNDSYPITAQFYAITAGSENPNIEPLIEWILSEQGQYIIEETGYVPVD